MRRRIHYVGAYFNIGGKWKYSIHTCPLYFDIGVNFTQNGERDGCKNNKTAFE
jgi:hypothetical protein